MNIIELLQSFNHNSGNHFEQFTDLASQLINNFIISKEGIEYRINEVEFYYHGDKHQDPFVHKNAAQLRTGRWYFHGSGADITFGNGTAHGGILLRGIVKKDDPKFINGPFKVFDELFVDNESVNGEDMTNVVIEQKHHPEKYEVICGPRSGLRLLASELYDEVRQEYLFKPYRFIALEGYPQFSEKYAIGLYQVKILQNNLASVCKDLVIDPSSFVSNCDQFDAGIEREYEQIALMKQSVEKMCMLYGILSERYRNEW
jgi:hypothetical protein